MEEINREMVGKGGEDGETPTNGGDVEGGMGPMGVGG